MLEEKTKKSLTLYLHGRPSAHPVHSAFAKAITQEFRYVDEPLRWQDKNRGTIFNLFAWFTNALLFKNKRKYDVLLVDNLHLTYPIMKMLGLLTKRQKTIVHLGSHTLYFMYAGKFSTFNLLLHKLALRNYDALICEGKMAEQLSKILLKEKCPPVYTTFLGPQKERTSKLKTLVPDFDKNNILVIANGPANFRQYYKGLDIMIESFKQAFESNNKIQLYIIGNWGLDTQKRLLQTFPKGAASAIHFVGLQNNLESYLSYFSLSSLCLHCSRGDAFPTSTIETMAAGIPTMVSEWTGTKEIVEKVDVKLIVPLNTSQIAERIIWYFNLSKQEKQTLSDKSRIATLNYNEEDALLCYQKTFEKICADLKISDVQR